MKSTNTDFLWQWAVLIHFEAEPLHHLTNTWVSLFVSDRSGFRLSNGNREVSEKREKSGPDKYVEWNDDVIKQLIASAFTSLTLTFNMTKKAFTHVW